MSEEKPLFSKITNVLSWIPFIFLIYIITALIVTTTWNCSGGDVATNCGVAWKTTFVNIMFLGAGWYLIFLGIGIMLLSFILLVIVPIEWIVLRKRLPEKNKSTLTKEYIWKMVRISSPVILWILYQYYIMGLILI